MKNIRVLALSCAFVHPLFCLLFSIASYWLTGNAGSSYKGSNLFFVLLFLFWYDIAALFLWHTVASAIDYEGGLKVKHAFWSGTLLPVIFISVSNLPLLWKFLTIHWAHQTVVPTGGEDTTTFWFYFTIAPFLGLAITMPHFVVYRWEFPSSANLPSAR